MTTLLDVIEYCQNNCHNKKTCSQCANCKHKELIIKLWKGESNANDKS
jgi:hypothetical protein